MLWNEDGVVNERELVYGNRVSSTTTNQISKKYEFKKRRRWIKEERRRMMDDGRHDLNYEEK